MTDDKRRLDLSMVSLFALTTTEQESKLASTYSLSLIHSFSDPDNIVKTLYLYRLYRIP